MFTVAFRAMAIAPLPGFLRRAKARLHSLIHRLAGIWCHALARDEFNRVDAATLRDLGMSRAEFDSYWAETHGLAEPTRQRVTQAMIHRAR